MDELLWIQATIALILGTFLFQVVRRTFDPFAPIWLFFVGYIQVYVVQAYSYHEWAVRVRGEELVTKANFQACWGLALFLGVYFLAPTRFLARCLPKPPEQWSVVPITLMSPVLVFWGLLCAGIVLRGGGDDASGLGEQSLLFSFPLVMVVAGSLLVVTGRQSGSPRPAYRNVGIVIIAAYMVIWMFNGKRSHSLLAVLVGLASYYLPSGKRPSAPVLLAAALAGAMAVGLSIGWRFHRNQSNAPLSFADFVDFAGSYDPSKVLESLNVKEDEETASKMLTHETEEYGAYLLMLDTVPEKSDFDFGLPYFRVFTTFIPRVVWPSKPLPGREQWCAAWVAGSELKRDSTFTGPAIGILGAAQLNGGTWGTVLVLGIWALVVRVAYDYAMIHRDVPWAQAFWALTYYNAWFSVVCDDPLNWFYYSYGFTSMPTLVSLWVYNKFLSSAPEAI